MKKPVKLRVVRDIPYVASRAIPVGTYVGSLILGRGAECATVETITLAVLDVDVELAARLGLQITTASVGINVTRAIRSGDVIVIGAGESATMH